MQDFFWGNKSWAFPNLENMATNNENPGSFLLEAANIDSPPPPQTAEPIRAPLAADTTAGRKRKMNEQAGNEVGGGTRHGCGKVGHRRTEKERRKKMRSMFADLHALLPQLPPKADDATVVSEAVNSIKSLQQTLEKLEKDKLERQLNGSLGPLVRYHSSKTIPTRSPSRVSREAFVADRVYANQLQSPPAFYRVPAKFKTWTSPNVVLSVAGDEAHISVCFSKRLGLLTGLCGVMENHNLQLVSLQVSSSQHHCMYMIHARANIVALENTSLEVFSFDTIFQQAAGEMMNYITSLRS